MVMPPQAGLLGGFASSLLNLANYISSKSPDIEVEILDLSESHGSSIEPEIEAVLRKPAARCFAGITTTTASYQAALQAAGIFKKIKPECVTVLGGHHASADYENVLLSHRDIVDAVVIGEGEKSLYELVTRHPDFARVPGIAYLKEGRMTKTPRPHFLGPEELDRLPITFPGFGLGATPGKFEHVTYVSARGCPLHCAFCAAGNEKIRAKSVGAVMKDIRQILKMGFTRIAIEDNFFAQSPARTRELCLELRKLREKRGNGFSWDCQTRVESLARRGTIALLEKAGCESVYIGVESFNHDHLIYLKKMKDPEAYLSQFFRSVLPDLLNSKINCFLNLQFGMPGETASHDEHTMTVLRKIGALAAAKGKEITIFPQLHVVYPGTAHFREGMAEGRFQPDVFETFTRWEASQTPVLFWLGEHFAHGAGGLPEGILDQEGLGRGEYRVNTGAVLRISGFLRALKRIPGVGAFDYGNYLVADRAGESIYRKGKFMVNNRLGKKSERRPA